MARGPIPDRPRNRPSVPEVQPLVDAFYQFDGCGMGGGLHSVLDDDNVEDTHIQASINDAPTHRAGHVEATQLLARLLLLLTRTQRRRIQSGYHGTPMAEAVFIARCRELLQRSESVTSPTTR